jgi:2-haloacid dehalogenase
VRLFTGKSEDSMKTIRALVFDLYGTLYDVHSVSGACEAMFPQRGMELSLLWRQKQLEYTWLRSLMGAYIAFEEATEDALDYCCQRLGLDLDACRRTALCDAYLRLAPFPEVPATLRELNARGLPLAILSNGSRRSIDAVVRTSGLAGEFAHLLSVDAVRVFKPDPRVYELAEQVLQLDRSSVLFVSSNAWDATGAGYFGYLTCWVNRGGLPFESMGQRPSHIVGSLAELPHVLDEAD